MRGLLVVVGDCREVMAAMEPESVDAIVTDPPYGLEFMGKEWDRLEGSFSDGSFKDFRLPSIMGSKRNLKCQDCEKWTYDHPGRKCECGGTVRYKQHTMQGWHETWAREALRVLKPGGHLLAFGGSRTYHRMACAVEDAGFEIRDQIQYLYGSGFPKSLDVSKAIDAAAGAERKVVGYRKNLNRTKRRDEVGAFHSSEGGMFREDRETFADTAPGTDLARRWSGWGTALKPACENVIVAQKPYGIVELCGILALEIKEAICQLPSFVRDAGESFTSSQSVCVGDVDSALWRAAERCSTPGDLFVLMDTLPSGSEMYSSLSIAWSWLDTLAALSQHASTFTTETASSLTTDLKILNCSPFKITPAVIIEAATSQNGTASSALLVADYFSAARLKLQSILTLSALATATEPFPSDSPDGAGLRPNAAHIVVARKPLIGTVAANVEKYGTGAINVDECRIKTSEADAQAMERVNTPGSGRFADGKFGAAGSDGFRGESTPFDTRRGRWPANVVLDEEAAAMLDEQSDFGGASRFFYTAKASREERETGLEGEGKRGDYRPNDDPDQNTLVERLHGSRVARNHHPTVKPVALMRWLVRLVTPPGGLVLDPFAGSGSTGVACSMEGFRFIGIEQDREYAAIAQKRIHAAPLSLFGEVPA